MIHATGKRRTAGFTLLEAIVALAILGLALVPMVTFIAQSADQLHRAADANQRTFTKQAALALMDPINPMMEASGELEIDDNTVIRWESREIVAPNSTPLVGGALSAFRLGLYNVQVSISRRDTGAWFDFALRKVGYSRIPIAPPIGGSQ